jgi:hypothetical protein
LFSAPATTYHPSSTRTEYSKDIVLEGASALSATGINGYDVITGSAMIDGA